MSDPPVIIEQVRVADLPDFYDRCTSRTTGVLPISRLRAIAQARNPHAGPDDVGLLAAFQGNRCIGYLGLLPGRLWADGRHFPIYWSSGWYVDPAYRHTSTGSLLLLKAFALEHDLFLTGLSHDSERVLRRLGLAEVGPLEYGQLELSALVDLITMPLRALRRVSRKMRIGHAWLDDIIMRSVRRLAFLKRATARRLLRTHADAVRGLRFEEVNRLEETNGARRTPGFLHDSAVINWMLNDRWVIDGEPARDESRYWFDVPYDLHRHVAIKALSTSDGRCVGFVVLSVVSIAGHATVRLLDYSLGSEDLEKCLGWLVVHHAVLHGADRAEVPRRVAQALRRTWLGRRLLRTRTRPYFYRLHDPKGPVGRALPGIELNLSDGDVAFT